LSGNIITDAQGRKFDYDAENKQKEVRNAQNQVIGQYFYDGDGRRVKKLSTTETVIFVYDAEGKLVAEYANQLSPTPQVSYLTTDALGSPRIKTDANGNVISRNDYLPFGEDLYTAQRTLGIGYKPDDIRRKFTTYKRDAETDLDFAEARYYSSKWGRFVSPDEFTGGPDELFDFADNASDNPTFYADLTNPQSLNKYQYTYNNPLNLTDPTGHCPWCFPLGLPRPIFGPRPIIGPRPITMPRPIGPVPPVPFTIDPALEKMVPPVEIPSFRPHPIPETQPSQMERRKTPYVPPKPRQTGKNYPGRKRAKDASSTGRNKIKPQPPKGSDKRANWENNQSKFKPERHPNNPRRERRRKHFHDSRKPENGKNKNRKPGEEVNNHNYYPNRF
jgi:RHS repeat-associated protein